MDTPFVTRADYGARDSIVALLVLALTVLMMVLSAWREWSTAAQQPAVDASVFSAPAHYATHKASDAPAALHATP